MMRAMRPDEQCVDVIKDIYFKYCDKLNTAIYSRSEMPLISSPDSYVTLIDHKYFGLILIFKLEEIARRIMFVQTKFYNSEEHITYERMLDYMASARWDCTFLAEYKNTLIEAMQNLYPKSGSLTKKASSG